ncbi:DNA (cytosine-5)-methyltransferase 3-like isoform X6 [Enhydra lutris kenyoni]|uniref:DNA (Cytosine-5)-methyltransferase 3-like isoform X6 n=1 Tax=Enhydra lutris kenyoni TaxID=391180 RepID=A0A2Y9KFL6_ENHLU|nr:DNA (cytosine-5)-methyltransferase 3-like isoform X6 [Enhydra lutris kenyoni]
MPILEPDTEQSMDVILVGSSELSAPASPAPCRGLLAHEIRVNQRDIEDVCICCGSFQVHTQHPLFEGGMCAPCKDKFLDCLFLYDDDGYQSYCSICCAGETLLICENPDCTRCYCFECVDTLVGPGTSGRAQAMSNWVCFLCLPFPRSGLLQRRQKWRGGLKAFCDRESNSLETYKTVPVWKREPVRVLSLFGDIRRELMSLGFLESGSAPGGLKHLDDVTDVVRKDPRGHLFQQAQLRGAWRPSVPHAAPPGSLPFARPVTQATLLAAPPRGGEQRSAPAPAAAVPDGSGPGWRGAGSCGGPGGPRLDSVFLCAKLHCPRFRGRAADCWDLQRTLGFSPLTPSLLCRRPCCP